MVIYIYIYYKHYDVKVIVYNNKVITQDVTPVTPSSPPFPVYYVRPLSP